PRPLVLAHDLQQLSMPDSVAQLRVRRLSNQVPKPLENALSLPNRSAPQPMAGPPGYHLSIPVPKLLEIEPANLRLARLSSAAQPRVDRQLAQVPKLLFRAHAGPYP